MWAWLRAAKREIRVRSEVFLFYFSHRFGGRKAVKSIGQQASSGFLRLRSGQALRLRAVNPLLGGRSARRFAQDDGLVGVLKNILVGVPKTREVKKVTTSQDD